MLGQFVDIVQKVGVSNFLVVAIDQRTADFLKGKKCAHYVRKLRTRTGSTDNHATSGLKFPWGVSPGATDGLSPPGPTIRPAPQLTPEESERKVRGGKPIGIWSDRAADAPAAPTDLKFLWHRDSRAPIRSPSGEFA